MTVEELEIQIRDNSESAVRGLDALAATLGKLKTVTSGLGLSGISRQIAAISSAAQSTPNDAGSKMQSLAKGLSALSTLGQLKVSPAVANQIRNLGSAAQSLNGVSFAPITQLSSALSSLGGIGRTNLTPTFNQLSKLPQIAAELKTVDFDGFTANVQRLSSALLPLSTMRGSGIGSVISQLGKLPAVAKQLKTLDFDDFARDIQRVTAALAPLSAQLTRVSGSLSAMSPAFRQASAAMNNVSARTSSGTRSFGLFGSGAFGASLKLGVLILAVRRLASVLSDMIDQSNKYIENLNLFTVAMRNGAAEAQSFAEHVSDLMGIDPSDWMRNQGVFNTLATGFGVAADRAAIMSKNLTQLEYDISSFFNISVEDSMQKLQSGISGELEPLRRLGYDLSQAKLEATALALGIDQSVSSMNQAQKAQLRYYAIMTQVTQAQGDMARTLTSPANQLRILQASFTQCARAIGNIFIPILNAVIPVAIAVVKVITMVANAIASLFGFSLPTVDYSGVSSGFGDIAAGAGDAADAMGGAADAAKALKRATVGLDELNILQTNNDTGGGGGGAGGAGGGGGGDFDFELPEYDFLADLVNTKTDEMVEKIQEMGKRLQSVFQPAIDKAKELFGILGGQAAQFDWAKQLGDTFWALAEAVSSAGELILSVLNPVIEALNIPEIVFTALETLKIAFSAVANVLNVLKPGLTAFSEKFLAPIAEWINKTVVKALEKLQSWITKISDWFSQNSETITSFLSSFGGYLGEIWRYLEPFLSGIVETVFIGIESAIDGVLSAAEFLMPILTGVFDFISGGMAAVSESGVWQALSDVMVGLNTAFIGLQTFNWDLICEGLSQAFGSIGDVFSSIGEAIKNELEFISEWFGDCVISIQEFFSPLTEWFQDTVWNPIVELFSPIAETIGGFFSDAWNAIVGVWNAVSSWFSTNIFDPLNKLFSEIRRVATEFFTQAWTNIKIVWAIVSWWFDTNIWSPIKNAVAAVTSAIGTFFSNAWNTISGIWRAVSNWFTSTVITPLKNAFSAGLNKIKDIFVNLWSGIRSVFKSVYSWFTSNVVNPIRNAFKAVANGVIGAINGMIRGLNSIHINIPSAVQSLLGLSQGYIGFNIGYIPYYAKGGFPVSGQLFMARENGIPEMVGQMGGRTAVANNDQIVDGIRRGVYEAQMEQNALLREEIALLRQLLAKESTAVAQVTTSDIVNGISRKNRRDGRVVVPVGT